VFATAGLRRSVFAQAPESLFRAKTLNHVSITSSDPQRTAAFYQRVFGMSGPRPLDRGGLGLDFNGHFLRLDVQPKGGRISQFCIGVDGLNPRRDATTVRAAGFDVTASASDYIDVRDPDGVSVRIADAAYAARCQTCPEPTPNGSATSDRQPALFSAKTVNHINFRVASLRRSVEFYSRLFGLPRKLRGILPASERVYALDFNECYLSITEGTAPSRDAGPQVFIEQVGELSHFCIGVEELDSERLRGAGLTVRGLPSQVGVRARSVYVADPDGISVQVTPVDWKSVCPDCPPGPEF